MKKVSLSLALLVAVATFLTIAPGRSISAQQRQANGAVPLQKLSLEERATTSPDSTVVKFRNRTYKLGDLRAAHKTRTTSSANAHASGLNTAKNLSNQKPNLVEPKVGLLPPGGRVSLNPQPTPVPFRRVGVNPGIIGTGLMDMQNWVYEPASDYASTPPDMKAFCAAAGGSACLYLPPQQQISIFSGSVLDYDSLISQSQCGSKGGSWTSAGWGFYSCLFVYPMSVTVTFTPPSNYQVSSTAECDQSLFNYQVDTHGAVAISIKQPGTLNFTTGTSPWCVVKVKIGG
jgi:hypothetical protein